jgi:hypothetical protein
MITTEAIKIAKNIEEAQKKAVIELTANGVLICLDTNAGKYAFVKYEDLPYKESTIGMVILELANMVKLSQARIDLLEADIKKLEAFRTAATEAIGELENKFNEAEDEGDPL